MLLLFFCFDLKTLSQTRCRYILVKSLKQTSSKDLISDGSCNSNHNETV